MTAAPAGHEVGLYYDGRSTVDVDDVLVTPSGRRYLVTKARRQSSGRHTGRQHLRAIVLPGDWRADDANPPVVHRLHWYRRRTAKATV